MAEPIMTRMSLFNCQVCVPNTWTTQEIEDWTNTNHECGTTKGWTYDEEGGRVQCAENTDMIHVLLNA